LKYGPEKTIKGGDDCGQVGKLGASPPKRGKRELVFDAKLAAPLNESRLYGGDNVLRTVALHMTTVSR
jgi:hypothetical protein